MSNVAIAAWSSFPGNPAGAKQNICVFLRTAIYCRCGRDVLMSKFVKTAFRTASTEFAGAFA